MSIFTSKDSQHKNDVIGTNTFFKGNIESKSTIQVDGKYVGESIKAEKLIISETGIVESDVFANVVVVEGVLIGNVRQSDRVILNKKGRLLGDVTAKELLTTEGVMLKGSFQISPKLQDNLEQEIKKASRHSSKNTEPRIQPIKPSIDNPQNNYQNIK